MVDKQADADLLREIEAALAKAFPYREPDLIARHFGDSTTITPRYQADTLAVIEDGYENFEAFADLIVVLVNSAPRLLTLASIRDSGEPMAKIPVRKPGPREEGE